LICNFVTRNSGKSLHQLLIHHFHTKNNFPACFFRFSVKAAPSDLIWPTGSHPKRVIALDYGRGTCLSRLRTARGKKSHMPGLAVITNAIRVRHGAARRPRVQLH
jgi:hypothetical protein